MKESVVMLRVVVEGNKSHRQQVNSEINTLKAKLAVGRKAASLSPDCSAREFQTAGEQTGQLEFDRSARLFSDSSSLVSVHNVNEGNFNIHFADGPHVSQTVIVDASQTLDHFSRRCTLL
jgi:hypothetical protein